MDTPKPHRIGFLLYDGYSSPSLPLFGAEPLITTTEIAEKTPSELVFDADGVLFHAHTLKFATDIKARSLETATRSDTSFVLAQSIGLDLKSPDASERSPISPYPYNMRMFHSEIYLSIRNMEPFPFQDYGCAWSASLGKGVYPTPTVSQSGNRRNQGYDTTISIMVQK